MTNTTATTIEPTPGESISETAARMIAQRWHIGAAVTCTFNDITLTTEGATDATDIVSAYWAESERRRAAYEASPEYAARMAAAEEAGRAHKEKLAEALKTAPETMTVHAVPDGDTWQHHVDINTDPYSACTIEYTALWGRLMEGQIAAGRKLEECAEEMSNLADTEGITGFMYGCAVSLLAKFWVHGEALRRWHNRGVQIGSEGDKANETGGVLNPAVMTIG